MPVRVQTGVWLFLLVSSILVPAALVQTSTAHVVRPIPLLAAVALIAAVAAPVIGLAFWRTRDWVGSLLIGTVTVFGVFWWGIVGVVVNDVEQNVGRLPTEVVEVFLAVLLIAGAVRWGRTWAVGGVFVLLLGGMVVGVGVRAVSVGSTPQAKGSVVASIGQPELAPDVILILLDGYPRRDIASEVIGHDSSSFFDSLSELGFRTNHEAWSNYNVTYASVSSMMGLEPLVLPVSSADDPLSDARGVLGGDGELFRAFSEAGYEIHYSVGAWVGSRCGDVVDRCHRSETVSTSLYWLSRSSVFGSVVPLFMDHPWTTVSVDQISNLSEIHAIASSGEASTAIWMHAVLPHPPVALDSGCTSHRDLWRMRFVLIANDQHDEDRLRAFDEQLTCVEGMLLSELAAIVERDPNTVIVLMSDHGSGALETQREGHFSMDSAQLREKMGVLRSIRMPTGCDPAISAPTTVESLRLLVGCVLDAEILSGAVPTYLVPGETNLRHGLDPEEVDLSGL